MNNSPAVLLAVASLVCAAEGAPPPKPKAAPPKPQPSVRDMANREARKCDANYDGRISGTEVSVLRAVWPANSKSWLYLFDDNGDKRLDDAEIDAIEFKPAKKPSTPSPFQATPKLGAASQAKPTPKPGAPSVFKTTPMPMLGKATPAKKDEK